MNIVFRVDASLRIGSGHVMRCLTLADALRAAGASCRFICRAHDGHMGDLIRQRGFTCDLLAIASVPTLPAANDYSAWVGADWAVDAQQAAACLGAARPDWLVVDHYGLDHRWEATLRPHCQRLLAIDDLANRVHDCDVLLDQNLGRAAQDYEGLVPTSCARLNGPRFALLRPEFAALRPASLARRSPPALRSLLVSMGGVDLADATGAVLRILPSCPLPTNARITVVMGAQAPWLDEVRTAARALPWPCDVRVNVNDMARLSADCDFAIGAAGSTAWERCCLGVPAALAVLADNQRPIANALVAAGAALALGGPKEIAASLPMALATAANPASLATMSLQARMIVDGEGTARVIETMSQRHD